MFCEERAFTIKYIFPCFLLRLQYQLLMTEAIMTFYSSNGWSTLHTTRTKGRIHWILMGLGATFAWGGMIVEYIFREKTNRPHLSTTHSLFGLISFVVTLLGVLSGTATLWSVKLKVYLRPLLSKCLHNSIGLIAFVTGMCEWCSRIAYWLLINRTSTNSELLLSTGMISLYYGFEKNLLKKNSDENIRMWLQIGSICTIILSSIGALQSGILRYKHIFS